MLAYNITTKVDKDIAQNWFEWQIQETIPEIMATGLFTENKFFKLEDEDESEGLTYVNQFFTTSRENYEKYIFEFAPALKRKAFDKWKDQFISFRTLLKVIH